jgi:uncharacterized protein (DUF736 family)
MNRGSGRARNVRIIPEANRPNDNAPSHRIFVGQPGPSARTRAAIYYLSVKLDDPSFTAPIYASLADEYCSHISL